MSKALKIHTETFGDATLRFVMIADLREVFVSQADFFSMLKGCSPPSSAPILDAIFSDGINLLVAPDEQRGALLEIDTIGPAMNVMAALNVVFNLSAFTDVSDNALREMSFRMNTVYTWLVHAIIRASDFFGIGLEARIRSAIAYLERHNQAFVVKVTHEEGMWIAECDAIGLVTEAETYEALIDRAREIAPELAELNGFDVADPDNIRLTFQHSSGTVLQHAVL